MSENLCDHITPKPSSLGLHPLDYYVWGVVEWETNKHPHNTLDSLRAAITRVRIHMDEDHLIHAYNHFQQRIDSALLLKVILLNNYIADESLNLL